MNLSLSGFISLIVAIPIFLLFMVLVMISILQDIIYKYKKKN